MITNKWERKKEIRDYEDLTEVERSINEIFKELFQSMMYTNKVIETSTIKLSFRQEVTKKLFNPKKATIRLECMMRSATSKSYDPKAIYKNGRNTTVRWEDGTVTTVKLADGEEDCDYTAYTAALAIKALGTNSRVKKILKEKTINQNIKRKKPD